MEHLSPPFSIAEKDRQEAQRRGIHDGIRSRLARQQEKNVRIVNKMEHHPPALSILEEAEQAVDGAIIPPNLRPVTLENYFDVLEVLRSYPASKSYSIIVAKSSQPLRAAISLPFHQRAVQLFLRANPRPRGRGCIGWMKSARWRSRATRVPAHSDYNAM